MSLFNRDCGFKLKYGTHGISFGLSLGGKSGQTSSKFEEEETEEIEKSQVTKATSTGEATTAKDVAGTTETAGTQAETGKTLSEQLSTVSALDAETQQALEQLLGGLDVGGLSEAQSERALGTEDRLSGITDAIIENARAQGEEDVGVALQGFARSAGSSQNTIVQQLGLKESGRVNREIADLAATLGIQVDQLTTAGIGEAAGAQGDLTTQLAGILKGAETRTATTGEQTTETDIVTALQEILATTETGTQVTQTTEEELVDALVSGTKTASGTGSGKSSEVGGGFSLGF